MRLATLSLLALLPPAAAAQAPVVAPADAPARTVVAPAGEAGDPLVVSGVVYADDGRTPLRGVSVYVYQTDARGYYHPDNARDSENPRLRGYMRTDAAGRYEFRTIRPGSYPGTRNPGHIHYVVQAPGYQDRLFEIVFEGDSLIPAQWRADARRPDSGVAIVVLERLPAGGWRAAQDVTLRRR
jgi:protocatechuate 3,4-dioxygenase beta subunit